MATAAKKRPAKKRVQRASRPPIDAEDVLARLRAGDSKVKISAALKVPYTSLTRFIEDDPERSAHARDAVQDAADSLVDAAELVLLEAKNPFDVMKARELAQHYRWRAKAQNPQKYGDKQQVDLNAKVTLADALRALDKA